MTYTLIDAPVDMYSTPEELEVWIAELEKRPKDDEGIRFALESARKILALVREVDAKEGNKP